MGYAEAGCDSGRLMLVVCAVQAGVGIFFQQEGDGNVYVKTIVSYPSPLCVPTSRC